MTPDCGFHGKRVLPLLTQARLVVAVAGEGNRFAELLDGPRRPGSEDLPPERAVRDKGELFSKQRALDLQELVYSQVEEPAVALPQLVPIKALEVDVLGQHVASLLSRPARGHTRSPVTIRSWYASSSSMASPRTGSLSKSRRTCCSENARCPVRASSGTYASPMANLDRRSPTTASG